MDGTLASLHRSGPTLTGAVWWALAAPVTLLPPDRPARVLVLGLGGGSVARALRALRPDARIVGVERDPQVLRAARRHFGLDGLGVELLAVDARQYLASETRRFDLVVEDLFVGPARAVRKPEWLLPEGYPRIGRRLRSGGIVSTNTIHETPAVVEAMGAFGGRLVSLEVRDHWNRILLCGRGLPPPRELRRRLERHPGLARVMGRLAVRAPRFRRSRSPALVAGAANARRDGGPPDRERPELGTERRRASS